MFYIAERDYESLRNAIADSLLSTAKSKAAAQGLNAKALPLDPDLREELREISGRVLGENLGIWPAYCLEEGVAVDMNLACDRIKTAACDTYRNCVAKGVLCAGLMALAIGLGFLDLDAPKSVVASLCDLCLTHSGDVGKDLLRAMPAVAGAFGAKALHVVISALA